jgi:hypothetical protein
MTEPSGSVQFLLMTMNVLQEMILTGKVAGDVYDALRTKGYKVNIKDTYIQSDGVTLRITLNKK